MGAFLARHIFQHSLAPAWKRQLFVFLLSSNSGCIRKQEMNTGSIFPKPLLEKADLQAGKGKLYTCAPAQTQKGLDNILILEKKKNIQNNFFLQKSFAKCNRGTKIKRIRSIP